MTERRTRGRGNNPGVTKRKIIELLVKKSDWMPEPEIRDTIANDLGIKEPKSTKIHLATALEEKLLLKETRSGVNYWNIDFNSIDILQYVIDILKQLQNEDRLLFFQSLYVQELVLKIAGFLARTNHPKTRTGYQTTVLSEYWGFLNSEPVHGEDDEELSEEMQRTVYFYQYVVTHSPSFFLYSFNDAAHIDPYLETMLGSSLYKSEWNDFDFLYFVGTMGLIIDATRSNQEFRRESEQFLEEYQKEISYHTSLRNPIGLFLNLIQAYELLQERHTTSGENRTQKAFSYESGIFHNL